MKNLTLMAIAVLPIFLASANFRSRPADDVKEIVTQTSSSYETPFIIVGARDEQTEQCRWLGTCPEPETQDQEVLWD